MLKKHREIKIFFRTLIIISGVFLSSQCIHAANHDFTGLPITEDGWTDLNALVESDSRIVYVSSSSGSDSTGQNYSPSDPAIGADPFDPSGSVQPYATLAAGFNQLRNGYPDILLLKRGDSWEASFPNWTKGGRSASQRMIISAYGTGNRPTLNIGSDVGFRAGSTDNLILSGIRFYAHTWETVTDGKCVDVVGQADNQLYEDCVFERNLNLVQGYPEGTRHTSIAFRRNHFIEGERASLNPSLAGWGVEGLLVEENIFYKPVEGNRHLYFDNGHDYTPNTIIRGNIFYTSKRTGLSIRSGGTIEKNLIVRNDLVLVGGHGGQAEGSIVKGLIRENVFAESVPNSVGDGEWGLWLKNNDGSTVNDNIWTDPEGLDNGGYAIVATGGETVRVFRNTDIFDNIIYGRSTSQTSGIGLYVTSLDETQNIKVYNNDFQMVNGSERLVSFSGVSLSAFTFMNNRYFSPRSESAWFNPGGTLAGWISASGEAGAQLVQVAYPDPSRNLKTYNQSIGGNASTEEFMAQALNQGRHSWDERYSAYQVLNYIRAGFGKAPVASPWQVSGDNSAPNSPSGLRIN